MCSLDGEVERIDESISGRERWMSVREREREGGREC